MKKCPTCEKTFDDAMRFCQIDGTPLIDEVPFDPYATIVGTSATIAPPTEPAATKKTPSESAISVPEDVLEVPNADPLKTMYVSDAEMKQVLDTTGDTPAEEIKADEIEATAPSMPEPPPPSFTDMAPPPSPFSQPSDANEPPVPAPPMFLEPEPATSEANTVMSSDFAAATPPPAPVQEWTPPPPPDASWQNQEIGSNTPFQPPVVGGENKTLAIVSLACGILSCLCCFSVITGPAGVITGFLAKKKADEEPSVYGGRGLAIGGMVTGAIGFLIGIAVIILQIFFGVLNNLS